MVNRSKAEVFQLHIALKRAKPKIWRRVLVHADIPLEDFSRVVQASMGWMGGHLYLFSDGMEEYAPAQMGLEGTRDTKKMPLRELLPEEKARINYIYDFGDDWDHTITLEKKLSPEEAPQQVPKCIGGRRNCPPEDCGGLPGYEEMLEVLEQPDHPEYEDYIEWLGGEFDPAEFDKEAINRRLSNARYSRPYG
jgi:hypothetical protein